MSDETKFWPLKKGVPTDEELSHLADSIPQDWKRLGAALGLKEKYLNAIEMNKPNDVYERALAVLQKWKKKMGRKATYGKLAEALNDQLVRRPELVKKYSTEIEDNNIWELKTGVPSDEVLQRLAHEIPEDWKRIGRAVGLKEKHLRIIEIDNADDVFERALATLYKWKEKQGQEATYVKLAAALDDDLVQRRDLVEEYCCDVFPKSKDIKRSQDNLDVVTDHPHWEEKDGCVGEENITCKPQRKSTLASAWSQDEENTDSSRQQRYLKMKQQDGSPNFQETLRKWKNRESFKETKERPPLRRTRRSGVSSVSGASPELRQEMEEIRQTVESALERMDAMFQRFQDCPSASTTSSGGVIRSEHVPDHVQPDAAAVLSTTGLNAAKRYDDEDKSETSWEIITDANEAKEEFMSKTDRSSYSLFDQLPSDSRTAASFLWRWMVGYDK